MNAGGVRGETLSEAQLEAARPRRMGAYLRAYCPFHGSDKQRSLSLRVETGFFKCFACGAWGYTEEARERRRDEWRSQQLVRGGPVGRDRGALRDVRPAYRPPEPGPGPRIDLEELCEGFRKALPGSPGERYLARRGIRLETALGVGVGYAAPGRWAHRTAAGRPVRQGREGRLVFPHTDPEGRVLNLYGRAVELEGPVPKEERHDHLPGAKGMFHAQVLGKGEGPLVVCEGVFDALTLVEAGWVRSVAVFGVQGMRWGWVRSERELVVAFDQDETGLRMGRQFARDAALRGKRVFMLTGESHGGLKDLNDAWVKGALRGRELADELAVKRDG